MWSNLLKFLGLGVVMPLVEQQLLAVAVSSGAEDTIERAMKIPDSVLAPMCAKTGADHATAVQYRDEAAKAEAKFLIYVATGAVPADDELAVTPAT